MPYIPQADRPNLEHIATTASKVLLPGTQDFAGRLNFLISTILLRCLDDAGMNYRNMNEIVGVLGCVEMEIYRRVIAEYEDEKIKVNGDVFNGS